MSTNKHLKCKYMLDGEKTTYINKTPRQYEDLKIRNEFEFIMRDKNTNEKIFSATCSDTEI